MAKTENMGGMAPWRRKAAWWFVLGMAVLACMDASAECVRFMGRDSPSEKAVVPVSADGGARVVAALPATARTCGWCGGDGLEEGWGTCMRCNGTGRVETPMGGVVRFGNDIQALVGSVNDVRHALRGKTSRGSGVRPMNVPTQTCPGCNGRGNVRQQKPCRQCGGTGYTR